MKKILSTIVFAALFGAVFTGCVKRNEAAKSDTSLQDLKERGVFILGLDDSFPPMGFRDDDSNIIGFDIDLAKEVAARLGVEFKTQPIEWSAKELELATGKIDCIWNGLTVSPAREKAVAFTGSYLNNEQVLVVRKGSGISKLSDMKGKILGIQSGSTSQAAVEDNKDFSSIVRDTVFFKDNITALNDLLVGGVDGVVVDSIVAAYEITKTGKDLEIIDESLSLEKYAVAFRKGDLLLRDEVQSILEQMAEDGTAAKISIKWFGSDKTVIGK